MNVQKSWAYDQQAHLMKDPAPPVIADFYHRLRSHKIITILSL